MNTTVYAHPTASENLYAHLRSQEQLRLLAYLDPINIWTIGWGHTDGVREGMQIDVAKAEELLHADVANVEAGLVRLLQKINAPQLNQGQWDGLVALCFNLRGGAYALPHEAPKLTAAIARGDWNGAAYQFLDINKAGGRVLPGLTKRRKIEAAMFLGTNLVVA